MTRVLTSHALLHLFHFSPDLPNRREHAQQIDSSPNADSHSIENLLVSKNLPALEGFHCLHLTIKKRAHYAIASQRSLIGRVVDATDDDPSEPNDFIASLSYRHTEGFAEL